MYWNLLTLTTILLLLTTGCGPEPLPRLAGPVDSFSLTDQYDRKLDPAVLRGKVRLVNFFFTSCPTICPAMQQQMLRMRETIGPRPDLIYLSHTVDPKRDTPERLRAYAGGLGIEGEEDNWLFLTGDKDHLYDLARDYWNIAREDESAPGGFDHTGRIVLVDGEGYIRAYTTGGSPAGVDTLIQDVRQLLRER